MKVVENIGTHYCHDIHVLQRFMCIFRPILQLLIIIQKAVIVGHPGMVVLWENHHSVHSTTKLRFSFENMNGYYKMTLHWYSILE